MTAIELELFRHFLASIAEEMGIVLRKTSYSANIKERRDYSCAVYDARGETVAMGDHMPVHLGAMPLSVRAVRDALTLGPGDVALVNDPFRGGTHLPDITAVSGVFVPGSKKASFYLANRAHHADVGGMSPGSMPLAREIFQEGLRIPPVLIQRGGKIDRGLLSLALANVRTPVEREGDLMAQLMSIHRGEVRLLELAAKYGLARVQSNMRALQDYSERMMRGGIRALPGGTYRFEDSLVCRLKLLQCEFPVAVSIHQTENYSHHRGCHAAAAPSIPVVMPVAVSRHCAAEHSVTHHPRSHHVMLLSRWTLLRGRAGAARSLGARSNSAAGEDSHSRREYERAL